LLKEKNMKLRLRLTVFCLTLLAALMIGGCYNIMMGRRVDGSPRVSVGFAEDEAKNLIHRRSGMVFPPEAAGFARDFVYIYDSHGGDVSVRYNLSEPVECFLDVYVYPAYGELNRHAAETRASIEAHHENARLIYQPRARGNDLSGSGIHLPVPGQAQRRRAGGGIRNLGVHVRPMVHPVPHDLPGIQRPADEKPPGDVPGAAALAVTQASPALQRRFFLILQISTRELRSRL
jgi:hypothetical protein